MKKRLLFLIIVLISIKLNSFAQISYENSLYHLLSPIYNYYLIQKVSISKNKAHNKYVNFYDFTTTDINIKNDSLLKYSEEFDSLGNLIHNIEFNDTIKNKIKEDIYYKYDLKNNIIKVHDAINEEEYFCNNTYDSIGNLTKRKWLDYKGHLYSFETYKYDIDTNVILFMRFSKDSTLMEQNETFYYPNGKIKYSN